MSEKLNKDKIIIIDFGSQVTKLIARRIREFNVYSEILTSNEIKKLDRSFFSNIASFFVTDKILNSVNPL